MPWWVTVPHTLMKRMLKKKPSVSLISSQGWRVMAIMMLSGKPPDIHVDISLTFPWKHYSRAPVATQPQGPLTRLDYALRQTMKIIQNQASDFDPTSKLPWSQSNQAVAGHIREWKEGSFKPQVSRPRNIQNQWTRCEIPKLYVIKHTVLVVPLLPTSQILIGMEAQHVRPPWGLKRGSPTHHSHLGWIIQDGFHLEEWNSQFGSAVLHSGEKCLP